jgi:acyl dehydratase
MDTTLYFEDFPVGHIMEFGSYTFTEAEIIQFARQFDPQPFHVDVAAAAESTFKGLIASGWHTCSVLMRMKCDSYLLRAASLGSPGIDEIRWTKPVRPGDTITGKGDVVEARPSSSKPDRGAVTFLWTAQNQNGEQVVSLKGVTFMKRRPAAA